MFHVKIWLGVLLIGAVTFHIWVMQPLLVEQVSREQDRLRPILAGQQFNRSLRLYYKEVAKRAEKIASTGGLDKIVKGIKYKVDLLTKTMIYTRINGQLLKQLKKHPIAASTSTAERFFVVARDGTIMFRSNKIRPLKPNQDKLPYTPHVNEAFQNRIRTGVWNVEGTMCVVAAAPIKSADGKETKAVILYSRVLGPSFFAEVNKAALKATTNTKKRTKLAADQKGIRVVLFASAKAGKTSKLRPIAYSMKKPGFFRGWFMKRDYDVIEAKYQEGMDRDLLSTTVQEAKYSYFVGHFPADLSPGNIGYALLKPIPLRLLQVAGDKKSYFMSGGPRLFALIATGLAFLLAIWLSASQTFHFRRILPHLQTAAQDGFPEIPENGLARPWRKMVHSINNIFIMIQERGLGDGDLKPDSGFAGGSSTYSAAGSSALAYFSADQDKYSQLSNEQVRDIGASLFGSPSQPPQSASAQPVQGQPAPAQGQPAPQQGPPMQGSQPPAPAPGQPQSWGTPQQGGPPQPGGAQPPNPWGNKK